MAPEKAYFLTLKDQEKSTLARQKKFLHINIFTSQILYFCVLSNTTEKNYSASPTQTSKGWMRTKTIRRCPNPTKGGVRQGQAGIQDSHSC